PLAESTTQVATPATPAQSATSATTVANATTTGATASTDAQPTTATAASDASAQPTGSVTLQISQEESEARFIIDEVLNNAPKTVVGTTNQVAGEIAIDPQNPTLARV